MSGEERERWARTFPEKLSGGGERSGGKQREMFGRWRAHFSLSRGPSPIVGREKTRAASYKRSICAFIGSPWGFLSSRVLQGFLRAFSFASSLFCAKERVDTLWDYERGPLKSPRAPGEKCNTVNGRWREKKGCGI